MSECSSELWRKRDGWGKPSRTLYDRQTGTSSRRTDVQSRGFIRIAESAGKADERHGRYLYFRLEVDRDVDPL